MGESESDGSADQGQSSSTNAQETTSKSLVKTKYYYEPKTLVHVGDGIVEPTPGFLKAARNVNAGTLSISSLFHSYGTHVCLHTLLGGWWRIQANYLSASSKSKVEMSQAASSAIQDAYTKTLSLGISAGAAAAGGSGGISAGFNNGKSEEESEQVSEGKKDISHLASKDSVLDVTQTWKGGASGVSPAEWRGSLAEGTNSNWKVIDRYVASCKGIWEFLDGHDDLIDVKSRICVAWRDAYFKEMNLNSSEVHQLLGLSEASCSGSDSDLRFMRVAAARLQTKKHAIALAHDAKECNAIEGQHWKARDSLCATNVCTCGSTTGEEGVACPEHGAEKCREDQKALCSTHFCGKGFVRKNFAERIRCAGATCSDEDAATCCLNIARASSFILTIDSSKGTLYSLRAHFPPMTVTRYLKGPFEQHGQNRHRKFTIDTGRGEITATQVCLQFNTGAPDPAPWAATWQPGDITIYNAAIGENLQGKIGTVRGFGEFRGGTADKEQCRSIDYNW